jgi:hypothetical protein
VTLRIHVPPLLYHAGQRRMLDERRRFNVATCGRRFGKTMFGLEQILFEAGGALDGYPVGWFAPTYKYLADVWKDAERTCGAITHRINRTEMRIELVTGGVIDFWTLEDENAGRGRKYRRVVIDESAHAKNLRQAWLFSISPTLNDYKGDAWFISTPNGRNFHYELHMMGDARNVKRDPEWQSWQMPTTENPFIDPQEIEKWRPRLPERVFAQEYLAAFIDTGGGVFRRVTDAISSKLPADPHTMRDLGAGHAYVIGVDWGRHNDFTVYVVLDGTTREVVAIDRFTEIEYAFQLMRLKALHERFPRAPILAESNAMGEPLIEHLTREGLPMSPFATTAASKGAIVLDLALAFEQGTIKIPDHEELVRELMSYDQERLPSGSIRYGAPAGEHDDCVMALAIAWHGVDYGGQRSAVYGKRTF